MRLNNIQAAQAQRYLKLAEGDTKKNTEKLSSGYRINRAADDAAGLSISEKMRRQIRGLTRASNNCEDGISMMQIIDGALAEVHEMLNRGTELCIHAANGTLSTSDRQAIQDELDLLNQEIDQISERTLFNEVYVLKGNSHTTNVYRNGTGIQITGTMPNCIQIDQTSLSVGYMANNYQTLNHYQYTDPATGSVATQAYILNHAASILDFSNFSAAQIDDMDGKGFYFTCCTCTNHYTIKFTKDTATNSMEQSGLHYIYNVGISGATTGSDIIDRIIDATNNGNPRSHYTYLVKDAQDANKLIIYDGRSSDSQLSLSPALPIGGTWIDWTGAQAFSTRANSSYGKIGKGVAGADQILDHIDRAIDYTDIMLQVGADTGERMCIKLPCISSEAVGTTDINVLTEAGADNGIIRFQLATDYVSQERSRCGSYQNRLEHTVLNLDNVVENTTASESRIRDADMALEAVEHARNYILQQAVQAVLSQANHNNDDILQLLSF